MPIEIDANRAAADFTTRELGPPSEQDLAGGHSQLFRTEWVSPLSLGERCVGTIALFPDAFAEVCAGAHLDVHEALACLDRRASDWWSTLQVAGAEDLGSVARAAKPFGPPEAWTPDAWQAVDRALQAADVRVAEILTQRQGDRSEEEPSSP
jgi:hypothetical protein